MIVARGHTDFDQPDVTIAFERDLQMIGSTLNGQRVLRRSNEGMRGLDPIQGTSRFLTHILGPFTEVGSSRSIAVVLQLDKVSLGGTHHAHHRQCSRQEAHL